MEGDNTLCFFDTQHQAIARRSCASSSSMTTIDDDDQDANRAQFTCVKEFWRDIEVHRQFEHFDYAIAVPHAAP
jgi:hypothetical protein